MVLSSYRSDTTHTDFFVIRSTDYSKINEGEDWDRYFKNLKNKKVTITDTRISYSDDDSKIVMDLVSKQLMEFTLILLHKMVEKY